MATPSTPVRHSSRFSWSCVPEHLLRGVLIDWYAGSEHHADRQLIRNASHKDLIVTAERQFGRPPSSRWFADLAPILLHWWVPELPADAMCELAREVGYAMNPSIRREAETIQTKKAARQFLSERGATPAFHRVVCKAFIRSHREAVVRPKKQRPQQKRPPSRWVLHGMGAADSRPPYQHTRAAWAGLDTLNQGKCRLPA